MRLLSQRGRLLVVASCIGIRVTTGAVEATGIAPVTGGRSPSSDLQKSCDIQLFNILNPSEENAAMNDNLYLQDFVQYNEDPLAFLTSRVESCGGGQRGTSRVWVGSSLESTTT